MNSTSNRQSFACQLRNFALNGAVVSLLALAACTEPGEKTSIAAATGGVIGAGLGAIVGNQTGDPGSGLVLGAVAGSASGALIGNAMEATDKTVYAQQETLERQEQTIQMQRREIEDLRRMGGDSFSSSSSTTLGSSTGSLAGGTSGATASYGSGVTGTSNTWTGTGTGGLAERTIGAGTDAPTYGDASPGKARIGSFGESASAGGDAKLDEFKEMYGNESFGSADRDSQAAKSADTATVASDGTISSVSEAASFGSDCSAADKAAQEASRSVSTADKMLHLRKAMRLCPGKAEFHVAMGNVYRQVGREEDAGYEFREALRLDPNVSGARQALNTLPTGNRY